MMGDNCSCAKKERKKKNNRQKLWDGNRKNVPSPACKSKFIADFSPPI